MLKRATLVIVALASFFSCVPPPPELCALGVELECTRQFECQSDAVKSSEGFKGGWGASVEECKTKVAAQAGCATKQTDDALCTGESAGKRFNVANASSCSTARKALSCADFLDPAKSPSVCATVCQ